MVGSNSGGMSSVGQEVKHKYWGFVVEAFVI